MNKISVLSLVGLTALSLTACSSGGSSASSTPSAIPNAQPSAPARPAQPANSAQTANSGIQGTKMNIANNKAGASANITNSPSLNQVVVNGQTVDFIPSGFQVGRLNLTANNMARIGGSSSLAYTRYGYVRSNANGESYLFAQGTPTTNMPTTGTATYKGDGVHFANGSNTLVSAEFSVDYGNKKLTGTVGNTALAGTINGSTFSGTKNGISTTGRFYGANAAELGGTYRNADGSVAGAYGAKK